MNFTITKLTDENIDAVCDAATEFWHESDSNKGLTLRIDKYRAMLKQYMDDPYCCSIVALDAAGDLAGYIHIYTQSDYTNELVGELYQFYVRKEYRGKGVARLIVNAADTWYKEMGCARAYSEVGHGTNGRMIGAKLFENLWSKFGFNRNGYVLTKFY